MQNYGCLHFLFDCFMVCLTLGLWLFWIAYRNYRNRKRYTTYGPRMREREVIDYRRYY